MDRRSFLAIIPSLGAIPLIGQDIKRTADKIEIIKPEPVRGYSDLCSIADNRLTVIVLRDGQPIGQGKLDEASIELTRSFHGRVAIREEIHLKAVFYGDSFDYAKFLDR